MCCCREFFHLLCLELVNPQYALFQSVNGLYRPNPNSAVNPNHLFYFSFFGKVLAKIICDGASTSNANRTAALLALHFSLAYRYSL